MTNLKIDKILREMYNKNQWEYNEVIKKKCINYCYGKLEKTMCHYKEKSWVKLALCNQHLWILHDFIKKYPNALKIHHFNLKW